MSIAGARGAFVMSRTPRAHGTVRSSDSERKALRRLPTIVWFKWAGLNFRIAHATPQGALSTRLSMDRWGECVQDLDCDFVLLGHSHVQGIAAHSAS